MTVSAQLPPIADAAIIRQVFPLLFLSLSCLSLCFCQSTCTYLSLRFPSSSLDFPLQLRWSIEFDVIVDPSSGTEEEEQTGRTDRSRTFSARPLRPRSFNHYSPTLRISSASVNSARDTHRNFPVRVLVHRNDTLIRDVRILQLWTKSSKLRQRPVSQGQRGLTMATRFGRRHSSLTFTVYAG